MAYLKKRVAQARMRKKIFTNVYESKHIVWSFRFRPKSMDTCSSGQQQTFRHLKSVRLQHTYSFFLNSFDPVEIFAFHGGLGQWVCLRPN